MKLITQIFSRYNKFFVNNAKIFISPKLQEKIDNLGIKHHDKLERFFEIFKEKEHLELEEKKRSDYEIFMLLVSFILNALKDKEFCNLIYESYEIVMDNFYEALQGNPLILIDKKFYNFAINEIKRIGKNHEQETGHLFLDYFKICSEKLYFTEVYNSLLLERDLKHKMQMYFLTHSIEDFFEQKSLSYIEIIEKANKKDFRIYIFDLLLKYGYLLEAYIKNILLFFLKLYHIDKGLKSEYLIQRKLTFGQILEYFKKYHIYFDSFLSDYRNAIFHSDFIIDYDVKLEERRITFISQENIIELTVKDLLIYFLQLHYLISTFEIVIFSILPKELLLNQIKEFFNNINEIILSMPDITSQKIKDMLSNLLSQTKKSQ